MTVEFNGKVITKNRYIGSAFMAVVIMFFPLVPIAGMTLMGEIMTRLLPTWFEPGIISSVFVEMWMGGVITLMGVLMLFGRKGSGLSINNKEVGTK